MQTMQGAGCSVGEYIGNGQGEAEPTTEALILADDGMDVDLGDEHPNVEETDDKLPLHIFYDCETTGFSIYSDHITDIAAKVVASPVPLDNPTFSSLVKTSRRIPTRGNNKNPPCNQYKNDINFFISN